MAHPGRLEVVSGRLNFRRCSRCQHLERRMAYVSELLGYLYSVLSDLEGRELARGLELNVQAFMRGQREGRLIHAERGHDATEKTQTHALRRSALRPCPICGSSVDWDLFERCSGCDTVMHHVCYYGGVAPRRPHAWQRHPARMRTSLWIACHSSREAAVRPAPPRVSVGRRRNALRRRGRRRCIGGRSFGVLPTWARRLVAHVGKISWFV